MAPEGIPKRRKGSPVWLDKGATEEWDLDRQRPDPKGHWLASFFPMPRRNLFCWSLVGGLFTIAAGSLASRISPPVLPPHLAAQLEDVGLIVQGLSALYLVYIAVEYVYARHRGEGVGRLACVIAASALVTLILLVEMAIELYVLKPAFGIDRSAAELPNLTTALRHLLWFVPEDGNAVPSGFALRQILIGLYALLFIDKPGWHAIGFPPFASRFAAYLVAVTFILVVCASRTLAGAHHPFDIAVGLGFGIFLFWWFIVTLGLWIRGGTEDVRYARRLLFPGLFFTMLMFTLGRSPKHCAIFGLIWFTPLLVAYNLALKPTASDGAARAV